jgi:hypothetical protein
LVVFSQAILKSFRLYGYNQTRQRRKSLQVLDDWAQVLQEVSYLFGTVGVGIDVAFFFGMCFEQAKEVDANVNPV